jgi:hypothetical protein
MSDITYSISKRVDFPRLSWSVSSFYAKIVFPTRNIARPPAGAKFFVLTTKHHDGVALFDTKMTSHRNTVALGAHRDFIRELMDTAKELHPNLKRGTYFSLPVSMSVSPLNLMTDSSNTP